MVRKNKDWLDDLYCYFADAHRNKYLFKEICYFMSKIKECGISYDELHVALRCTNDELRMARHSGKTIGNIVELFISTENNNCYKYKISKKAYDYLYDRTWYPSSYILEDFMEDSQYKDFDIFISDQYKTVSCRAMSTEPDYKGDNMSVFVNIKRINGIKNFCKKIDNLDTKKVNMFEIFEMYRSVYQSIWCRGNKYRIREQVIYNAVISFYKFSEAQRKQVKFFDFLIVEIMKQYVLGHKDLDVSEMFHHEDLLPCPFCGKQPKIRMQVSWFELIVTIECEDCEHLMRKNVVDSSGINQPERLQINSFKTVINELVSKWNCRIKNDDMWLDDETLPDELPECEPDTIIPNKVYAPGLKRCPFCGSKAAFVKRNSAKKNGGKRDPEGIKTIKVVCSEGCFSASYFGTPERVPDKHTIGYMAYRWNNRKILA